MSTSHECPKCLSIGIHSRVKRVYYRLVGKYSEIGWLCPSCMRFYPDWDAYVADYNRIFETDYTVEKFKDQVWWINERISIEGVFEKKKTKALLKAESGLKEDPKYADLNDNLVDRNKGLVPVEKKERKNSSQK